MRLEGVEDERRAVAGLGLLALRVFVVSGRSCTGRHRRSRTRIRIAEPIRLSCCGSNRGHLHVGGSGRCRSPGARERADWRLRGPSSSIGATPGSMELFAARVGGVVADPPPRGRPRPGEEGDLDSPVVFWKRLRLRGRKSRRSGGRVRSQRWLCRGKPDGCATGTCGRHPGELRDASSVPVRMTAPGRFRRTWRGRHGGEQARQSLQSESDPRPLRRKPTKKPRSPGNVPRSPETPA